MNQQTESLNESMTESVTESQQDTLDESLSDAEESVVIIEAGPEAETTPAAWAEPEAEPGLRAARAAFVPLRAVAPDIMPRKEDVIELPASAVDDILAILSGAFFEQTGVDLASRPDELERFGEDAARVCEQLQEMDSALVERDQVLDTYYFQTVVLRETVMALQALREVEAERSGSIRAWTHLPAGMFMVPDQARDRLLLAQVQHEGRVFWQLNLGQLGGFKSPRAVMWLPQMRMLVTDQQSRQVTELCLDGRQIWQLDSENVAELALRSPVKSTVYFDSDGQKHYLIVDQGHHRVFDVTPDQKLQWQYGVTGQSRDLEGYLNLPSDIHYTPQRTLLIADTGNHRVLEIQRNKIIRSYGEADGLDWPVFAERLSNGHTLVVDQARHCIFEFNDKHQRVHECVFFRPGMDERFKTGKLNYVQRLGDDHMVISDGDRLLEVDWRKQNIVWFGQLKQLQQLIPQPVALLGADSGSGLLGKSFERYEAGSAAPELVTLRQMLMKEPLFADAPAPVFFDELEKLLRFRDFQPGAPIVEKGKALKSMYFIQTGSVEILAESDAEAGSELKAGESFGQAGIIYVEPRQASIRAKSYCGLYELEKKAFDKLIADYPDIEARVNKLAAERLVVAKMRQGQSTEKTQARFQEVLAMQKARFSSAHKTTEPATAASPAAAPAIKSTVTRPSFRPRQAEYTEAEKLLIHDSLAQGQQCLEVHVFLHRTSMMKGARAYLLCVVLGKLGTILRSIPSLEAIQSDQTIGYEVIVTLATQAALDQVIEDASSVAEVDKVEVVSLSGD
ncbi:MAG: hypothetical protein CVV27_04610 [Candidatus Melainabacteria bacterium HGW-Melainabacteria-1]|nr:MAG: hypothetical protein CVV27_04610 [Candidatus Melainabacteria bacterium HGW-Melainabacteria-1]